MYDDETLGAKYNVEEIPADLLDRAKEYREKMMDAVAEFDEQAMEKYLNGQPLTEEEIRRAIRAGVISMKMTPILCGSAFKNKGVQQLLDGVVDFLPSPLDVESVTGIDPNTEQEVKRRPSDSEPFAALSLQDYDRSVCGSAHLFPSILGHVEDGNVRVECDEGDEGSRRTSPEDACEQA